MNRRLFLRGLGGACVAAPFLGSIVDRSVKAATPAAPRRFIAMFTHYGCITTRWFPSKSHGELTAESLAPTTLKVLAPYVDKLLLPRGIRSMNQWTTNGALGQVNDQHLCACGSYFTCQPVTPNATDPFSFETATRFNAMPKGPSLDHVMAAQLSPDRTPLVLRPGNGSDSAQSEVSYSAAETPYVGLGLPSQAYAQLTGLFQDGMPVSPDSYQAIRGQSVIDLVRADLETLERMDMSQADRNKLEAWKALLHDTGGVMASAQCTSTTAQSLGATPELLDVVAALPADADSLATELATGLDVADVYSNVAALAAVCNANPVILLKYPPYHVFSALGIDIDAHTLSHRLASTLDGFCVNGWLDLLLTIDAYYAQKFARLVGLLDGIEEGDGKVLDNSAAIWFNEMSDGNAHNLNNLPIVQVGSCGGYFRTGLAINVEDGSANLSNGASEDACNPNTGSLDVVVSSGTDPAVANAPINKYFCNIMNALGVKAGEDGFAAEGGSAEVTHFGMYDKTEDFVGGGSNPPMIHDPGGFEALKASS